MHDYDLVRAGRKGKRGEKEGQRKKKKGTRCSNNSDPIPRVGFHVCKSLIGRLKNDGGVWGRWFVSTSQKKKKIYLHFAPYHQYN